MFKEKIRNLNTVNLREFAMLLLAVFSLLYIISFFIGNKNIAATTPASDVITWNWDSTEESVTSEFDDAVDLTKDDAEIDPGVFGGPLSSFTSWLNSIQTTMSRLVVDKLADVLAPDLGLMGRITQGDWKFVGGAANPTANDITREGMTITKTFWAAGVFLGVILATILILYNAVMLVAGKAQAIHESPISALAKYFFVLGYIVGSATIINFVITTISNIWTNAISSIEGAGGLAVERTTQTLTMNAFKMFGIALSGSWLFLLCMAIGSIIMFFKLLGGLFNMLKGYFEKYILFIILLCLSPFFVATLTANTMKQSFSNYMRMLLGQFLSMFINFLVMMTFFNLWIQGAFSASFIGFIVGCAFIKLAKNIDRYISMTGLNVAQSAVNTGRGFLANAANAIRTINGLSRAAGQGLGAISDRAASKGDMDTALKYRKMAGSHNVVVGAAWERFRGATDDQRMASITRTVNDMHADQQLDAMNKGQVFGFDAKSIQDSGCTQWQVDKLQNACTDPNAGCYASGFRISRDAQGRTSLQAIGRNGSVLGTVNEKGNYVTSNGRNCKTQGDYENYIKDSMAIDMAKNNKDDSLSQAEKLDKAYDTLNGSIIQEMAGEENAWAAFDVTNGTVVGTAEFDGQGGLNMSTINQTSTVSMTESQASVNENFDRIQTAAYNDGDYGFTEVKMSEYGGGELKVNKEATAREAISHGMSSDGIATMYRDYEKGDNGEQVYQTSITGYDKGTGNRTIVTQASQLSAEQRIKMNQVKTKKRT